MTAIKKTLVEHYIGTVVVALFIVEGLRSITGTLLYPVNVLLAKRSYAASATGFAQTFQPEPRIDPANIGFGLLQAAVALGVAYLLLKWLYLSSDTTANESGDSGHPASLE